MSFKREVSAFSKAQVSAFIGGIIDYGVMILCVEFLGWHYVLGIILGGLVGALVNFTTNRYWTFRGRESKVTDQLVRFLLVVSGSIALKSLGTSFMTEILGIDYRISRLITDALVSFGFNYTLQRYWVFKGQF